MKWFCNLYIKIAHSIQRKTEVNEIRLSHLIFVFWCAKHLHTNTSFGWLMNKWPGHMTVQRLHLSRVYILAAGNYLEKWHSQLHHVPLCSSPRGDCLAPPNIISDSKEQKFTSWPPTSPDSWKLLGVESGKPNSRPGEGEIHLKLGQRACTMAETLILLIIFILYFCLLLAGNELN